MSLKRLAVVALLGMTAWAVSVSCKSTGELAGGQDPRSRVAAVGEEPTCTNGGTAQADASVLMNCCGFVANFNLCTVPKGQVTFQNDCAQAVGVRFSLADSGISILADGGTPPPTPFVGEGASCCDVPGNQGSPFTAQDTPGVNYLMTFDSLGAKCDEEVELNGSIDIATTSD